MNLQSRVFMQNTETSTLRKHGVYFQKREFLSFVSPKFCQNRQNWRSLICTMTSNRGLSGLAFIFLAQTWETGESQTGQIQYFLNRQDSGDLHKTYSKVVGVHLFGLSLEALRESQITPRGKPFVLGQNQTASRDLSPRDVYQSGSFCPHNLSS